MEYLKTLILSIIGGIVMTYLNAPLPWTLGPIVFVALGSLVRKRPFRWSLRVRKSPSSCSATPWAALLRWKRAVPSSRSFP